MSCTKCKNAGDDLAAILIDSAVRTAENHRCAMEAAQVTAKAWRQIVIFGLIVALLLNFAGWWVLSGWMP